MMKKIIILLMLIVSLVSFSEVNDEIGLLNGQDKKKVQEKVDEVSKKTGLNVYLNFLNDSKKPQLKDEEKSVIINIVKSKGQVEVDVNFTQDIPIEEYTKDIDATLDNLSEFMIQGKTFEYTEGLLNSVEESVLSAQKNNSVEESEETKKKTPIKGKVFLIIFIMIGLFFYRKKFNKLNK